MEILANKFILLEDLPDFNSYNQIIFSSSEKRKVEICYGDSSTIVDSKEWENHSFTTINKSLFPSDKIDPLFFKDIDEHTVIAMKVRKDHLLYNTTFSYEVLNKDVLFSRNHEGLLYLFSFFQKPVIKIASSICYDHTGIIEQLKSNYRNNKLREEIIDLIGNNQELDLAKPKSGTIPQKSNRPNNLEINVTNFETVPNNYLSTHLETARVTMEEYQEELVIKHEENRYRIIFKGIQYEIPNSLPLLEALTILTNNLNLVDPNTINEFWKTVRLHNKNIRSVTKPKLNKSSDHFESILKNFNRLIKELKEYENKHNISLKDGFTKFLIDTVKISRSDYSISCLIPSSILIKINSPNIPSIKK